VGVRVHEASGEDLGVHLVEDDRYLTDGLDVKVDAVTFVMDDVVGEGYPRQFFEEDEVVYVEVAESADGQGYETGAFSLCKVLVLPCLDFEGADEDGASSGPDDFQGSVGRGVSNGGVGEDGAVGEVVAAVWAFTFAIVRFLFPVGCCAGFAADGTGGFADTVVAVVDRSFPVLDAGLEVRGLFLRNEKLVAAGAAVCAVWVEGHAEPVTDCEGVLGIGHGSVGGVGDREQDGAGALATEVEKTHVVWLGYGAQVGAVCVSFDFLGDHTLQFEASPVDAGIEVCKFADVAGKEEGVVGGGNRSGCVLALHALRHESFVSFVAGNEERQFAGLGRGCGHELLGVLGGESRCRPVGSVSEGCRKAKTHAPKPTRLNNQVEDRNEVWGDGISVFLGCEAQEMVGGLDEFGVEVLGGFDDVLRDTGADIEAHAGLEAVGDDQGGRLLLHERVLDCREQAVLLVRASEGCCPYSFWVHPEDGAEGFG